MNEINDLLYGGIAGEMPTPSVPPDINQTLNDDSIVSDVKPEPSHLYDITDEDIIDSNQIAELLSDLLGMKS